MADDKEGPKTPVKSGETPAPAKQAASKPTPAKKDSAPPPPKKTPAEKRKLAAHYRRAQKVPDNTECQNCGAHLRGDYCHNCGQAAREPRRAVIGLVQDVFVDTLAIDGKLARTIGLLLWRPGRLAKSYLDGKRVTYSPPFRLYLFASVFFFFTSFLLIGAPNKRPESLDPATTEEVRAALQDAQADVAKEFGAPQSNAADAAPGESKANAEDGEETETTRSFKETKWEELDYNGPDWLEPHAKRVFLSGQRAVDDPRLFLSEIRQNTPRFLLLAPLTYGLVLALLYIYRRKFFIFDHFIVSLYMHAALYAYLLLALLISRIPVIGGLWFVPIVWGGFQPLLVFRHAYGSGWVSAVIKWFVSNFIYFVAVALIIILGLSYSLYQS